MKWFDFKGKEYKNSSNFKKLDVFNGLERVPSLKIYII